jgi:penicillin-binding protein 2
MWTGCSHSPIQSPEKASSLPAREVIKVLARRLLSNSLRSLLLQPTAARPPSSTNQRASSPNHARLSCQMQEEVRPQQNMSAIKIILRIVVLGSVLFALIATSPFISRTAARERKGKTKARAHQAREGRSGDTLRNRVQSMIAIDETAGEDMEVRRVALSALGNHAGTIVVMDPKTGRIYSIVNQQWALREGFKPCSTIKLVTGLAGLNEKLIDTSEPNNLSTNYRMDLTSALAHSNNAYFQKVGGRVGFEKLLFYARQLGLGEKTGINASNESAGRVPLNKSGFALNHMSSHGDDFQVTAVQLATLVSAMTNGGKLLTPYIPNAPHIPQEELQPRVRRQIKMDTEVWSHMVPGMIGAVNYGSGRRAYNPLETIAGKTGTCIQEGTWVGLFASYAPLANPRLTVVVIGLGPDARGHFPAAVAGEIYRNLNHRFGMLDSPQLANSKAPIVRQGLWINNAAKGNTVKSVLMSVPKRTEGNVNSSTNSKIEAQAPTPPRVSSVRL